MHLKGDYRLEGAFFMDEKPKRIRKGKWPRRIRGCLLLVVFVLLVPCCWCSWTAFIYPQNFNRFIVPIIKYPGSTQIHTGGPSAYHRIFYIYWTPDSASDVIAHYERYKKGFPPFVRNDPPEAAVPTGYPVYFSSYSNLFDMGIIVLDATQLKAWQSRESLVGNFRIPDDAPEEGALFIMYWYDEAWFDGD